MPRTAEQCVEALIGQLMIRLARALAELEAALERIAHLEAERRTES